MKSFFSFILVSMVGCSSAVPIVPHKAEVQTADCLAVYYHAVGIKASELQDVSVYGSVPDLKAALALNEGVRLLDQEYRKRGTMETFMRTCEMKYNQEQIKCLLETTSLEHMSLCAIAKDK